MSTSTAIVICREEGSGREVILEGDGRVAAMARWVASVIAGERGVGCCGLSERDGRDGHAVRSARGGYTAARGGRSGRHAPSGCVDRCVHRAAV